jgi:hypothetical protein
LFWLFLGLRLKGMGLLIQNILQDCMTSSLNCSNLERIPRFTLRFISFIIFPQWKLCVKKILSFFDKLLPTATRTRPEGGDKAGPAEAVGCSLAAFGLGEKSLRD